MSLELRRCPFCGGEAEVREVSEGEQVYYVECTECNIRTPLNYNRAVSKAKWNARVAGLSEIMETVKQAFIDLIDDADEGKYKNYTQAALIHECYGKAITAIEDECLQYEDVPTESHSEKIILKRCIALMQGMVDDCEAWIKWQFGEDCLDNIPEEERFCSSYSYFEIVQQLFLWVTTHSGGTSTRAKCKELGVKPSERITFKFEGEDDEN